MIWGGGTSPQTIPQPDRGSMPGTIPGSGPMTAEEMEARKLGERMGAEGLARAAGHEPFAAGGQPQRPAQSGMTRERILQAETILIRYKAGKASVDRRIVNAQDWWKLRNWRMIEAERGIKGAQSRKSNTAWLWNCIVGKHADATDSYPEPVILPREINDRETANTLSEILPVVLQLNEFEKTYSDVQWQKLQEGTGAYGVFWDKTKLNGLGDISIRKINLLNLVWEPGVDNLQDSKHVFYVTLLDRETIEQQYPETKGKLKPGRLSISKYRTDDNQNDADKIPVVDWYYHVWEGPRKILHYCKFVGDQVLFATEGNEEYRDGLYADGDYPFVLDALYPVEGSPAGYGLIDVAHDAQTDIDTLSQAMVMNAAANATPRYFVRKDGAVNEEEFADFSKPFVHVGGGLAEDMIRPITSNQLTGSCFNMLQQKIDELKFVTGNTDVNNGGVPSGVTAASAIAALKEDSGRSSKDSTRQSYRAYREVINLVIERIRQFYDMPRQFRIIGKDGSEQFQIFDNSGMQPQPLPGGMGLEDGMRKPVYDVEVHAQRENAYTRMSQNELAIQFYQLGMFNPQATDQSLLVLQMMDFKGKDELEQKIRQNGTMVDVLTQVSQIAMALAQKYQPEVADQLAGVVQGVMGQQAPRLPGSGGEPTGVEGVREAQKTDNIDEPRTNENKIVQRARERSANATRVD